MRAYPTALTEHRWTCAVSPFRLSDPDGTYSPLLRSPEDKRMIGKKLVPGQLVVPYLSTEVGLVVYVSDDGGEVTVLWG